MNEFITIVSGLPRSGTSMMMNMLEAGGMQVVVDNMRHADEDNPKGYYEFEQVKNIRKDRAWLENLRGKAVKMVSMLLYDLPGDERYKIVFMLRNMNEILTSQRIMLDRRGEPGQDREEIARLFSKHLDEIKFWLAEQKNIEVLFVNYNEIIENSIEITPLINMFFDARLNVKNMVTVVDEKLYRQRNQERGETGAETLSKPKPEGHLTEKEKIEAQLKSLGYM